MKRLWPAAIPSVLLTLAALATSQAHALGRLADVSIVDRSTGATLPAYYHRGEYWVAGHPGARYGVMVRNRLGERLLAVAAVDGVNVLTGDTAGWDQQGYVFNAGQLYQITGWRKSNAEVAAFEFTASPNSYAERTGRPANVGVIGVALFRERLPELPIARWPEPARHSGPVPLPAPAPAAPAADASTFERRAETGAAAAAPALKLGTGHGQREASYVTQTEFMRLQSQPNEVIRIRYDSRENLVAMGVIRDRHPQPSSTPNPFPESAAARYVPDPPPYR
jgi:hypothetical protein